MLEEHLPVDPAGDAVNRHQLDAVVEEPADHFDGGGPFQGDHSQQEVAVEVAGLLAGQIDADVLAEAEQLARPLEEHGQGHGGGRDRQDDEPHREDEQPQGPHHCSRPETRLGVRRPTGRPPSTTMSMLPGAVDIRSRATSIAVSERIVTESAG